MDGAISRLLVEAGFFRETHWSVNARYVPRIAPPGIVTGGTFQIDTHRTNYEKRTAVLISARSALQSDCMHAL